MRCLLGIGLVCLLATPAAAGSGTPSDPWHNQNFLWYRPTTIPYGNWISQTYQDIQVTNQAGHSFWATNPRTERNGGGFYIGPQTDGLAHGTQCSGGCNPQKLIAFSFFSPSGRDKVRMLNATRCTPDADGGGGVSCSYLTNWTYAAQYRFSVDIVLSTNPNKCPESTPNACLLYKGYFGLTSQPLTRTLIATIAADIWAYGDVADTFSFVEPWANGCDKVHPDTPDGNYIVPRYTSGSTGANSNNLYGWDNPGQDCGRVYINTFVGTRQYVVDLP